uniref:Trehalose transporter 1b n=1 Tax=Colaphellus bowringi TaxID=561076 RepID=A0A7D4X8C7_9CUCU|nr:trehalose transporter 1b [Colaphellus bowringi]
MKKFSLCRLFGARIYQYLAAVTATLCILSSEMHFGWSSPSLPALTKGTYRFQITGHEASWLAVALLPGTILGAVLAGKLTGILGRRKVILLTSIPLLAGWIMIGLANNVTVLYVARFVAGISSGLSFSTVPMYLGEIAEPQIRGMLASLCPVFVVFGILLINILGNYLPIDTTAFVSCIFPVILFLTFIWMPESPSFLLQRNRTEEAKATLVTLRGEEAAKIELEILTQNLVQQTEDNKSIMWSLFLDKVNRRAATIGYGLRTIQQFCGATAITFYCKTIFEEEEDFFSANLSTILYFSLQLVIAFIAIFVVDIFGRKPLLLVSSSGCCLTLLVMSAYLYVKESTSIDTSHLSFVPLLVLFLNVGFFSIGVRNIPLLMMGEVFSPRVKPIALCFGTIYYSIMAIVSAKIFYLTKDAFGMYVPFLIFGFLTFLSIFFVVFVVPETKGLRLEDIQLKLGKKKDVGGVMFKLGMTNDVQVTEL